MRSAEATPVHKDIGDSEVDEKQGEDIGEEKG